MTKELGVIMDSIGSIAYQKDSTLAMLWEAAARDYLIYYIELKDLFLRDGRPFAQARLLQVFQNESAWFAFKESKTIPLDALAIILMRKDPPFNEQYIYATYLLEFAQRAGTMVVNRPQALRDANEKLFAAYFPQCSPPTLVTQSQDQLKAFWREHQDIVCKPLNTMGGTSVFRLREDEVNANVILETLTQNQTNFIMAQQFIPEIKAGDKRIMLIDGEPIPYALVRLPQGDDWRGNLNAGAKGIVEPLSARDRFICEEVGPHLKSRGLYFVGLDIIGDYLTEINVTSPTGIRQLDTALNGNISASLFDCIEKHLAHS